MATSTNHNTPKKTARAGKHYRTWTAADERTLLDMYNNDVTYENMAKIMQRTVPAIQARLKLMRNDGRINPSNARFRLRKPEYHNVMGDAHLQQDLFDQPNVIDDTATPQVQRDIPDDFYGTTWDREYNMGITIFAIACAFMLVFALVNGDFS